MAFYDNALFGQIVDDARQVRNLSYVYNNVLAALPSKEASLDMIEKTAREIALGA